MVKKHETGYETRTEKSAEETTGEPAERIAEKMAGKTAEAVFAEKRCPKGPDSHAAAMTQKGRRVTPSDGGIRKEAGHEEDGQASDGETSVSQRNLLRTAEVLSRAQITHQVLYRYITLGLIEPAQTTPSGLRLFHPKVVALIKVIKDLNERYSLRDMKDIFFKDERVKRLSRK